MVSRMNRTHNCTIIRNTVMVISIQILSSPVDGGEEGKEEEVKGKEGGSGRRWGRERRGWGESGGVEERQFVHTTLLTFILPIYAKYSLAPRTRTWEWGWAKYSLYLGQSLQTVLYWSSQSFNNLQYRTTHKLHLSGTTDMERLDWPYL